MRSPVVIHRLKVGDDASQRVEEDCLPVFVASYQDGLFVKSDLLAAVLNVLFVTLE